jgi:hypothetical protein
MNNINVKAFYFLMITLYGLIMTMIGISNKYLYKNVIDISFFYTVSIFMIVLTVLRAYKNFKIKRLNILTYTVLLFLLFITFISIIPKYNYKEAFALIPNQQNATDAKDFYIQNINLIKDKSFFVKKGYVFHFENNNGKKYLIVNPLNGSYYYSNELLKSD